MRCNSWTGKPPASTIIERLSDEDEIVRMSIVQAIQKHGNGRSTINALVDALQKEKNNAVVDKMVETIASFEASAIEPTLKALMKKTGERPLEAPAAALAHHRR